MYHVEKNKDYNATKFYWKLPLLLQIILFDVDHVFASEYYFIEVYEKTDDFPYKRL